MNSWSGLTGGTVGGSPAGSGTAYATTITVDFGAVRSAQASANVTGLSWITANTRFVVTPYAAAETALTVALLQFSPVVHTLVVADGFSLLVYTPVGATGAYTFFCIGVVP
jgi:hypothetical protein